MDHNSGGEDTPDSPLSFSIPASLQEYMGRYSSSDYRSNRAPPSPPPEGGQISPATALSPASFPVRRWFDDGGNQPSSAISPADATRTPSSTFPARSSRGPAGTPSQSDYLAAWRSMSGPPLLGPIDSGCEDEEPRHRVFESGGRPQTRSASRNGRHRASREARSSGGGSGGGDWSAGGAGNRVEQVPFSPMVATAGDADNGVGIDTPAGRDELLEMRLATAEALILASEDAAQNFPGRHGEMTPGGREEVIDELAGVEGGSRDLVMRGRNERPTAGRGQQQTGRRSLSDFLREIEEMVRAQRAQSGNSESSSARTQSAPQVLADRTRPFVPTMPVADYSGGSPSRGDMRYVLPGETRRPTRRSTLRAGDIYGGAQPPQRNVPNRSFHTLSPVPMDEGTSPSSAPVNRDHQNIFNGGYVPRHTSMPTVATAAASAAAAVAAARATASAATRTLGTAASGPADAAPAAAAPMHRRPLRLSAAATAFSLGLSERSASTDEESSDRSSMEERGRWHVRQQQHNNASYAAAVQQAQQQQQSDSNRQQQQQQQQQLVGPAVGGDARGDFFAAVAAARAVAAGRRLVRSNTSAAAANATAAVGTIAQGGLTPRQQQVRGAYMEMLSARASGMTALASEEAMSTVSGAAGAEAAGGNSDVAGENRRYLSVLPAFRHWESQRPRLRIQWHDPAAQSEATPTESLPSDGTLVLTEHMSAGPSPRGFCRNVPGSETDDASEVEEAFYCCLTCLGVRRLLLARGRGTVARCGHYRAPGWLDDWLDSGASLTRANCSEASGDEIRCPRVGDVWELLELLLAWWAERVCAVAAGFPVSEQASAGRGEGRRDSVGSSAGDVVAAAQAVESVQELRKLGEYIIPLKRARDFICVAGGPTPRDAVLLKSLLVVHEGIAWATDRPLYSYYRKEVIPTAMALYASLPQDALEGVDLEVGHTLPESVFVVTGTVRPSWPRWGGSTPSTRDPNNNNNSSSSNSIFNNNDNNNIDIDIDNDDNVFREDPGSSRGVRGRGFVPGPWVVFRVARREYLEFYKDQAEALEQAIGDSAARLEDMLC